MTDNTVVCVTCERARSVPGEAQCKWCKEHTPLQEPTKPKSAAAILEDARTLLMERSGYGPPNETAILFALVRAAFDDRPLAGAIDALRGSGVRGDDPDWPDAWQRAIDACRKPA